MNNHPDACASTDCHKQNGQQTTVCPLPSIDSFMSHIPTGRDYFLQSFEPATMLVKMEPLETGFSVPMPERPQTRTKNLVQH